MTTQPFVFKSILICSLALGSVLGCDAEPVETFEIPPPPDGLSCYGATPESGAWQAEAGPLDTEPSAAECQSTAAGCAGDAPPDFTLRDFQPQSCGFEASYGLSATVGRPTFVALLAAWCGYCRGQTVRLQALSLDLRLAGIDVDIVIINAWNAVDDQQEFIDRCGFPLLQDQRNIKVWDLMGGKKDDFFYYKADGTLSHTQRAGGDTPTNLSTDEGYAAVRAALVALAQESKEGQ